ARSDYGHIRRRGIRVESRDGDFDLPEVAVYAQPEDIGPVDLILIGLKTTANHVFGRLLPPLFTPDRTALLCLQNGIGNEEQLARIFPDNAIIGGTAFLCSNRVGPGHIHHTDYGHVHIAAYADFPPDRLTVFADVLNRAHIDCTVIDDYLEMRWRKQVWNVPFNGLCTLHNQATDALLQIPGESERIERIMHEVITLARALHARRSGNRPFHLDYDWIAEQIRRTRTMGAYLPSMLLDRRAGRPIELESIIGVCLRKRDTEAPEVQLPAIQELYTQLSATESGPV
ncbi:MAG: 2-dehydropantoate 2-reductase, partial [Leptospiraceae bacterium]|nr:2-dehydropantoate 2-reductase [Leptospiraceae bacterium]